MFIVIFFRCSLFIFFIFEYFISYLGCLFSRSSYLHFSFVEFSCFSIFPFLHFTFYSYIGILLIFFLIFSVPSILSVSFFPFFQFHIPLLPDFQFYFFLSNFLPLLQPVSVLCWILNNLLFSAFHTGNSPLAHFPSTIFPIFLDSSSSLFKNSCPISSFLFFHFANQISKYFPFFCFAGSLKSSYFPPHLIFSSPIPSPFPTYFPIPSFLFFPFPYILLDS